MQKFPAPSFGKRETEFTIKKYYENEILENLKTKKHYKFLHMHKIFLKIMKNIKSKIDFYNCSTGV